MKKSQFGASINYLSYSFVSPQNGMSGILVEQQLMFCRGVKLHKPANVILIVSTLFTGS